MSDSQMIHEALLDWRGIDPGDECQECAGAGVIPYSSTSTWRGGVGGMTVTSDVCNKCWGSGNRHRPWPSHRLFKRADMEQA